MAICKHCLGKFEKICMYNEDTCEDCYVHTMRFGYNENNL
jgi:hypothetical protein